MVFVIAHVNMKKTAEQASDEMKKVNALKCKDAKAFVLA